MMGICAGLVFFLILSINTKILCSVNSSYTYTNEQIFAWAILASVAFAGIAEVAFRETIESACRKILKEKQKAAITNLPQSIE